MMFTAPRRMRSERTRHDRKSILLIAAALIFANATAIIGLGATARAEGFPDALHYAPMTWEKPAPVLPDAPALAESRHAVVADTVAPAGPVGRASLDPIRTGSTARQFTEIHTTGFLGSAAYHHRFLLIGVMIAALGAMAGVSVHMFRTLAQDISESERKRRRF